jgi:hypothetical protein
MDSAPHLDHYIGRSISLRPSPGAPVLWTYTYGGKPKPFFHPVTTPKGHLVTINEPHDHIWHRGLWFTLKYVNGINFWEEPKQEGEEANGVQTTLLPPTIQHGPAGEVFLESRLSWNAPDGSTPFLEDRLLAYRPLDHDSYALDWDITLTPQFEVTLDRTPYGAFGPWGGYSGLTLRGNRNWQNTRLLFADGTTTDRPLGHPANWADLSGIFDGGFQQHGGIALFDHPENRRHPSPWYGSTGAGHYFNAAIVFHEPLILQEGETLRLRYRALIHDGQWDAERLNAAYQTYCDGLQDD